MGGVSIITSNKKGDSSKIFEVIKCLKHRGDFFGLGLQDKVFISNNIKELKSLNLKSNSIIGYNFFNEITVSQPIKINNQVYVFDGEIFTEEKIISAENFPKIEFEKDLINFLKKSDGAYVLAIFLNDKLFVARDPLGLKPLYYWGENNFYVFSSEKKALWRIGIKEPKSFPPGVIAEFKNGKGIFKKFKKLPYFKVESKQFNETAETLANLILNSIKKRSLDLKEAAVAFSGGIDSSLIAYTLNKIGVKVTLFTVGVKNKFNYTFVEKAAEELNLPLEKQLFTINELKKVVKKVLWIIEEPNLMKLEVAIPIFWVSNLVFQEGYKKIFLGQGADELFGGYKRYAEILMKRGREACFKTLFQDVIKAYEVNYERDEKVTAYNMVELRLPYTDWNLVSYVINLPVEMKIKNEKERKIILREAAKILGLPKNLIETEKKAIQYETGVHKGLIKNLKFNLNYLKRLFNSILKQYFI